MYYYQFLKGIHQRLTPETYLEIGIRNGVSLALAECRAVGIDPAYSITAELNNDIALFRTTSDEYFSRPNPLDPTGGRPFDLAFIDGLHLFEFALRDFIFAERYSSARSVIIFDDVLPRSIDEAARLRHTHGWTGDVFRIIDVLARYRPEITVLPVGTKPTGLLLVVGLDPTSNVLRDNYDEILNEYRGPDPQPVPPELLDRLAMLSPQRVLDSDFWSVLSAADPSVSVQTLRPQLGAVLAESLGPAYGMTAIPH